MIAIPNRKSTIANHMTSLGIDIGGTSVKLAAIENGQTLWTGQSPFYSQPTTDQLIDAIGAAAKNRTTNAEIAGRQRSRLS